MVIAQNIGSRGNGPKDLTVSAYCFSEAVFNVTDGIIRGLGNIPKSSLKGHRLTVDVVHT